MNGVTPLALTLPVIEQTQQILLETDHRKLTSEIAHLPYGDIAAALTLAHRRIHTLNRCAMPTSKRFQATLPFHHAFIRFKEYYRQQVCARFQNKATAPQELDLLLSFIQELGFAHKRVIQESLNKGKLPKGFVNVLYMAMMYSLFFSLFSYNRSRMLGPGHWQEFHSLFNLACELELHDLRFADLDKVTTSIEDLYKKSVLLGLGSPYARAPEEQWDTLDYLHRFAYQVTIYPLPAAEFLQQSYSASPECLSAANIPGSQLLPHPATNLVDCSGLLDKLHKQIHALKMGQSTRTVGLPRTTRNQAEQLLSDLFDSWSRAATRNEERRLSNEQIGLVWGLENICAMLDTTRRGPEGPAKRTGDADNRAWSVANDESTNGFCVRIDKNGTTFPESGQVVALIRQQQGRQFLELGLVKWAAIGRDDTPRCGIQRIHGNTRKITIHAGDEIAAQRNGLLISGSPSHKKQDTRLVAPVGTLKLEDRALLKVSGPISQTEVKVDSLVLKTRNVDVFKVEVRGS